MFTPINLAGPNSVLTEKATVAVTNTAGVSETTPFDAKTETVKAVVLTDDMTQPESASTIDEKVIAKTASSTSTATRAGTLEDGEIENAEVMDDESAVEQGDDASMEESDAPSKRITGENKLKDDASDSDGDPNDDLDALAKRNEDDPTFGRDPSTVAAISIDLTDETSGRLFEILGSLPIGDDAQSKIEAKGTMLSTLKLISSEWEHGLRTVAKPTSKESLMRGVHGAVHQTRDFNMSYEPTILDDIRNETGSAVVGVLNELVEWPFENRGHRKVEVCRAKEGKKDLGQVKKGIQRVLRELETSIKRYHNSQEGPPAKPKPVTTTTASVGRSAASTSITPTAETGMELQSSGDDTKLQTSTSGAKPQTGSKIKSKGGVKWDDKEALELWVRFWDSTGKAANRDPKVPISQREANYNNWRYANGYSTTIFRSWAAMEQQIKGMRSKGEDLASLSMRVSNAAATATAAAATTSTTTAATGKAPPIAAGTITEDAEDDHGQENTNKALKRKSAAKESSEEDAVTADVLTTDESFSNGVPPASSHSQAIGTPSSKKLTIKISSGKRTRSDAGGANESGDNLGDDQEVGPVAKRKKSMSSTVDGTREDTEGWKGSDGTPEE